MTRIDTTNSGAPGVTISPTPLTPWLVDRHQTAKLLGISLNTVSNLVKRGELIPVRIGTRVLFDVQDIKCFIEGRKGGMP